MYFPVAFHPESSKRFTDQDSSFLSVGPRPSAGVKRRQRALVFLDQAAVGLDEAVSHLGWSDHKVWDRSKIGTVGFCFRLQM